jgi:hypothetical protein
MKRIIIIAVLAAAAFLVGCQSNADKVSHNLSVEAERFNVQRRIVGVNGITDKVEFQIVGRCSIEGDGLGTLRALTVICKQGPHDFRKHYVGMSDNMFFISTQLKGLNVSQYHTEIILKPQNIVPDLQVQTG